MDMRSSEFKLDDDSVGYDEVYNIASKPPKQHQLFQEKKLGSDWDQQSPQNQYNN